MNNIFKFLLAVLIQLLFFSCKPRENFVYMDQDKELAGEIEKAKFQGLLIDAGDVLEINVNGFDELAVRPFNLTTMQNTGNQESISQQTGYQGSEYTVDENGDINFPVLGKIQVLGLTKVQLAELLEKRLFEYVREPFITVLHKNFSITVLGEVQSPGQKSSVSEKLNLFQALALAGDMTINGDRTQVKLIRTSIEGEQSVILDLTDQAIVNSPYFYLQQNDIIYVMPDKNKQIIANSDPNRQLYFQLGGLALTIITLIISVTR